MFADFFQCLSTALKFNINGINTMKLKTHQLLSRSNKTNVNKLKPWIVNNFFALMNKVCWRLFIFLYNKINKIIYEDVGFACRRIAKRKLIQLKSKDSV